MSDIDTTLARDDADERFRQFAATRDLALRDELVTEHLDLARQLSRRFAHRSEPLDDLMQVASIGLIKAVEGFDPDLGFAFSAYATRTILGELKRHFRDRGWSIRAPRRVQELYLQLGPAVEELSQRLGRSPTVSEVSQEVGASEDEVLEAFEAGRGYRSASLDEPGPDGESQQTKIGTEDRAFTTAEERSVLLPALEHLPERERTILQLRFVDDLTQSEIAARVGISQMHVSRLLARSLTFLRQAYHDDA
jgi:RNA polymerase sigma-B factor